MKKIVEIIEVIVSNDSEKDAMIKELLEIQDEPQIYLKNNDRLLSTDDDYLWLAMVNILIKYGFAFEIDWTEDYIVVKSETESLLEEKFNLLIELPMYEEEIEPEEFFLLLKKDLRSRTGLQLFNFYIDSDSYVSGVVEVLNFERLKQIDDRIKTY